MADKRSFRGFARHAKPSVQVAAAACIVFAIPLYLFYRLILFHFYVRGGLLLDTGLLASVMYHNTAALTVPPSVGGGSFFATHVAPVLLLVSVASDLLPVSMPQMFAGFVGICHGLLGLPVFWLLASGYGMRCGRALALAALASLAFAFNGLSLAIAKYPHFETFGAACLLLFFVALVLEKRTLAIASFLPAIATREDLGLHAFGFLSVWAALDWWHGATFRKNIWIVGFGIAGLGYSIAAIVVQHLMFPATSSFVRIYLGDPPFHHITTQLVTTRLAGWIWLHPAIVLPAIVAMLWSRRNHDPYMMIGFVACIPWALLNLFARSDHAGLMVGYYAYPFLIAMIWPWLAVVIRKRQSPALLTWDRPSAASLLAMVALTLLPIGIDYDPGHVTLPQAFLRAPSAARQSRTDDAVTAIVAARAALGRLVVDNGVAALRPLAFPSAEIAGWADAPANTIVMFPQGYDAARLRASQDLPRWYRIPGTELVIATDIPERSMEALGLLR